MQINMNQQNSFMSFGMLKKSQLNSMQRTFSEITKPPLEKFKTVNDLYEYSDKLFEESKQKVGAVGIGFQQQMADWFNCAGKLLNIPDGHLWRALICKSIQNDKHDYVPMCIENIVVKTIKRLTETLKQDSQVFNFHHEYTDDMNREVWNKFFNGEEKPTGWIKFERGKTEEENEKVIKDIRLASAKSYWCTKIHLFADAVTENGKFYVYFKDGYPTLGVRTEISVGYRDGEELTYEIKNWLNKAEAKQSPMLDELQKKYPSVVIYDNNIGMM